MYSNYLLLVVRTGVCLKILREGRSVSMHFISVRKVLEGFYMEQILLRLSSCKHFNSNVIK